MNTGYAAREAFKILTRQKPLFGKGWLFLAKTELSLARISDDGLNPAEWKSLSPYIEKAYKYQPRGAWMGYRTGQLMLQNREVLSEFERQVAVARIKQAMEVNPEKYLSLSFWRDEDAVKAWRNNFEHRAAQKRGRSEIFQNYRLRVSSVIRDYGMLEREQTPEDSLAINNGE